MKRFAIITILAAVVASGHADATLAASKAECLSTCAPQIADACGGFRRAKYNRCRLRMVRRCRRFGAETTCPAPLLPAPATTPTTVPVAVTTTTTTVPYIPPTTTTTLPALGPWTGVWNFVGSLYSNTCPGAATTLGDQITIVQTGPTVQVTVASVPAYVGLDNVNPDGSFSASGPWTTGTCNFVTVVAASPTGGVIAATAPASVGVATNCPGAFGCETIYSGVLTRTR